MFSFTKSLVSSLKTRRTMIAAPLALVAASSSVFAAGPWNHWDRHEEHSRITIQPRIVFRADIPAQRVVLSRPVLVDEVPAGMQLSAYQSADRVIVFVSGTNRGRGFATSLAQIGDGTLMLHNTAPFEGCREGQTAFTLSVGMHAERELRQICVRIGDRSFEVPVACVQNVS